MRMYLKLPILICLLIFFCFGRPGISGVGITAYAFEIDADTVLWNHLSYRAKSIIGKMTTDIKLTILPAGEVADFLMAAPGGGAVPPSSATVCFLKTHSNIHPLLGFKEILTIQAWVDSNGAAALQRTRQRLGKEKWQKSYRYTGKGVFRLKKMPQDSKEANLPLEQWTKARESFYPYEPANHRCSAVLEPSGLLLVASVIKQWKQDTPILLCVFNKKQLYQVKVSVGGLRRLKVNYIEKSGTNQTRRNSAIDAIQISFEPRSLVPNDEKPEKFSFMGLKGDFDMFLDPTSYLPVQVSGKISAFSKLDIRLVEVQLKQQNN